ncbi:MAG TPA: sigma 54-interacting transcriptional regulator [Candidatus Avidesulfovibrio excrementigallinarum]|nr:sigma 54-interacting transcriptional regulator [Candidatus Avidesulfovibrio excrementigallinarum]
MKPVVLVVDDDESHRGMLRTLLRRWGYAVEEAGSGAAAEALCREKAYDAILSDIRMAEKDDGIRSMRAILADNPAIPVIMMTGYSSVETAVEALRFGAYDYLMKPLDFDQLKQTLTRALAHTRHGEATAGRDGLEESSILGNSPAMQELTALIATVAPSDATVLITGESGTGKELVARAIQRAGTRQDKPFVTINCAAISESLLESELFGHEKGAFTGADRRRDGRFAQADGGTLFLDEIGELPLQLQAKLLRALQQGEVQRVGSDTPFVVDVRVIAATNRDLRQEVAEGRFREDLYYRLNVIGLEVPPLRRRKEDIPLLAGVFLKRFAQANRKDIKGFTPQAMALLNRYSWPGNVRELENAVERAVILCPGGFVSENELPMAVREGGQEPAGDAALLPLDEVERQTILATLRAVDDNKSEAARRLGITRATLHNKLRRYGCTED